MNWLRMAVVVAVCTTSPVAVISCVSEPAKTPSSPNALGSEAGRDASSSDELAAPSSAAARIVVETQLEAAEAQLAQARANYKSAYANAQTVPADAGALGELDAATTQLDAAAVAVAELKDTKEQIETQEIIGQAKDGGPLDPKKQDEIEFETGGRLRYGVSVSLLQISATRSESEPGRMRNYAPKFEAVPPEVGFQFTHEPAGYPWRLKKKDGSHFQLLSWGGMLLAGVRNSNVEQGALRLGATLNFFENVIGIGAGFDLYRGIPVLGANGVAGAGTAYTGVLAWALAKQGEVTPENFFFVVTLGVYPIVKALSGEVR